MKNPFAPRRLMTGGLLTAAVAAVCLLVPTSARALPSGEINCRVFTYYSNIHKTNEVGVFAMCPGGSRLGRRTPWFTVETVTVGHPQPIGHPIKPGNLPCEFLAAGCSNLPEPR